MSVVRMSRLCVPEMKKVGGRLINVTALSVLNPLAGFGLSASTWAGVVAFAKTLSRRSAPTASRSTRSVLVASTRRGGTRLRVRHRSVSSFSRRPWAGPASRRRWRR